MRRAQSALEYLFILAAVLILVMVTIRVVFSSVRALNSAVTEHIDTIKDKILETL
ncbi:class III signal peptide-containing protein [Thermococcus aggregans]|uniref:Class III signal peptide-containing protein n=1 Tax=Thermococcus aggregans TaxID=110163 RepID=A0A9E7SNW1_THEAG|nr:class III signal peptide-containing protein [Thermococcus aggregans]USS40212.1 class III signal peptide-containing protein [Thermococcus aggregans]